MPKRNELEHKALQSIANTGDTGVLQVDLWRQLDASSREGSRLAIKLENKGLIRRERELFEGRWTYRLYPKRKPVLLDSVVDCPCLKCVESTRCHSFGDNSPGDCENLTEWVNSLAGKDEVDHSGVGIQGDS